MSWIYAALIAAATFQCAAAEPRYKDWSEVSTDLIEKTVEREYVPMRDGLNLDALILLPNTAKPPYPTVLIRSPYPYDGELKPESRIVNFLQAGYAVMMQNERGRYWSQGDFEYLARAGEDGYDTIDWIAKQKWSNGKVGTIGCSSTAENQLRLNSAAHPAHAAAIALGPGAGIGRIGPYAEQGNLYRGGALQLLFAGWYRGAIVYGAYGDPRPQFPGDLSQEDRIRISKAFPLTSSMATGAAGKELDHEKYFSHLPVIDLNKEAGGTRTEWERFARRTPGDPAWREIHLSNEGETFGVPMLWGFSWYDVGVAPNVALYNYAREHSSDRARGAQQMIISPVAHCAFGTERKSTVIGDRELGDARMDYDARFLEWFDYWLKDVRNDAMKRPAVQYYQMGANRWVNADRFPINDTTHLDLFLDSAGRANTLYGDGILSHKPPSRKTSDGFIYDPLRPVETLGGGACCMGSIKAAGSYDQSTLEMRSDILVYTTEALDQDLNVAGPVEIELYVSSDAKDTDFTVKLIDVYPDGAAYNLDDTIFRARYREGWNRKVLMKRDEVYKLTIPPMITANTFKKGHRVRIEVSSSNFPRYDRNLNTGGNNYDESKPVVAHNRVHHSGRYASKIRLPVSSNPPAAH